MTTAVKGVTMMILNRNFTHTSLYGHSIRFEKDVPVAVPNAIVREVVAIGALRDDGEDAITASKVDAEHVPQTIEERTDLILDVIEDMTERNDRDEFTGTGLPKLLVLSSKAGFKVDKTELNRVLTERANRAQLEERDGSN
jgi:hypothetical protein